jgi:CxxC-x17-CxxC domain-containing protein
MYQDKTLTCKDCGNNFTFTASEQEFFASKGFTNEPGRCPLCRAAKKEQNGGRGGRGFQGGGRSERQMYPAVCASCGAATQVPFQPSGDKPVYCRDCYQPRRQY